MKATTDDTTDGYTAREAARGKRAASDDIEAEIEQLNWIIKNATDGWNRSLEPELTVQKTDRTRDGVIETSTVATRRQGNGDPRFLSEIQAAMTKRAKLLRPDD